MALQSVDSGHANDGPGRTFGFNSDHSVMPIDAGRLVLYPELVYRRFKGDEPLVEFAVEV